MKKRIIIILLLVSAILFTCPPAQTAVYAKSFSIDNEIKPYYTYISSISTSLSIDNGNAICLGGLTLRSDLSVSSTITLQRSSNGTSWTDVKSWSKEFTGIGAHSFEKEYNVSSGYYYRVLHTVNVKNGDKTVETASIYSSNKYY